MLKAVNRKNGRTLLSGGRGKFAYSVWYLNGDSVLVMHLVDILVYYTGS